MTINKLNENGRLIFVLEGKLDTNSAPALQEVLIPAFDESNNVLIDMQKLAFITSAGLRTILMGIKTAKAKDASLKFKNVSNEVMDVLHTIGFADFMVME